MAANVTIRLLISLLFPGDLFSRVTSFSRALSSRLFSFQVAGYAPEAFDFWFSLPTSGI
jgi:hypothetical protein